MLWADVLAEFPTVEERRFEIFHTTTNANRYSDFRFHAREVEGIHQGWSDGSVRWTPRSKINLDGIKSPDLRLQTMLGNFYF